MNISQLSEGQIVPGMNKNGDHVYHLYLIQAPNHESLIESLKNNNISIGIHYPTPLPF